jgi:hypothetical protein
MMVREGEHELGLLRLALCPPITFPVLADMVIVVGEEV